MQGQTEMTLLGASTTAALGLVVSLLFSVYLRKLARLPVFYGSLAAVVAPLAWLWLMSFALLIGGHAQPRLGPRAPPPSPAPPPRSALG